MPIWSALGALPKDVEKRKLEHAELSAPTQAGKARRKLLNEAIAHTAHEFGGIGIEMNQRYVSSAIYRKDEANEQLPVSFDAVLYHEITTYPGSRLPHAWSVTITQPVAGASANFLRTG